MSKRNATSSLWKLPLFSGTETPKRRNLQYDPNDLLGQLPGEPPWQLAGLALWLDAGSAGTIHGGAQVFRWDDRSPTQRHATQTDPGKQPAPVIDTLVPRTIQFEG